MAEVIGRHLCLVAMLEVDDRRQKKARISSKLYEISFFERDSFSRFV